MNLPPLNNWADLRNKTPEKVVSTKTTQSMPTLLNTKFLFSGLRSLTPPTTPSTISQDRSIPPPSWPFPNMSFRKYIPPHLRKNQDNMATVQTSSLDGNASCTQDLVPRARTPSDASIISHSSFVPNDAVFRKHGIAPTLSSPSGEGAVIPRGPRYKGNPTSKSFARQFLGLPDHFNCAVFITAIPTSVRPRDIFDSIHEGPVFCLHVNDTDEAKGITTLAAKLVFKYPQSAAAYIARSREEGIYFGDSRVRAVYNRFGYTQNNSDLSRVIRIQGPDSLMSTFFWKSYFERYSVIVWDRLFLLGGPVGLIVELRFSRIDGQAQTCYDALQNDDDLRRIVIAQYGRDPCDETCKD